MKTFEEYLKEQLSKPVPEWFDPNGNSPRSVITRGKFGTLKYEAKRLIPSLKRDLVYSWGGFDTPVSYFFQLLILPFIFPFLPFLRAFYSYKDAIKEYRDDYEKKKKADKL